MKKLFLLSLIFVAVSAMANVQVIFDPATLDTTVATGTPLPAGMTLVKVDGKDYVQVVTNDWNSLLTFGSPVTLEAGKTTFQMDAKYKIGTSADISVISQFLQLQSADGSVKLGSSTSQAVDTMFNTFRFVASSAADIGQIQVAGQVRSGSWPATTGDTIWFGKIIAITVDPKAIFDPANIDPSTLPAGVSIVEVGGVSYCQIITNDWKSTIPVYPYTLSTGTNVRTHAKYNTASGDISTISMFLKFTNTANVELSSNTSQAVNTLNTFRPAIKEKGTINVIQVAGQVRSGSWPATTGDTIWLGKVREIVLDPAIAFDPAQYDPSELPAGMSIVKIKGKSYLQAVLNDWKSTLPIDDAGLKPKYSAFSVNTKYAVGNDTADITSISAFIKFSGDNNTEIGTSTAQAVADFNIQNGSITKDTVTSVLQIAGQVRAGSWPATTGDTLWLGAITLKDAQRPTNSVLTVTVDGTTAKLDWTASTDNDMVQAYIITQDGLQIDSLKALTLSVTGLTPGTSYVFGVQAVDKSGNYSVKVAKDTAVIATVGVVLPIAANSFAIYPNPAAATLNVSLNTATSVVTIFDLTGKAVLTKVVNNGGSISVANLKGGVYFVKANNSTLKLIKE